jgi:aminoglycoside/choline kinase family phosphotransferase
MDAPPDKGEDTRPFIHIANHLRHLGLSAPDVYASDVENGLMLIEDLGDDLFARVIDAGIVAETPLYEACVDVLGVLHNAALPDVAAYDADTLSGLAGLPFTWYHSDPDGLPAFRRLFYPLCQEVAEARQVLVLRDYHAENLLWLPEREGFARVGLLDFQDAMICHPAYDLVSVLQDARRDVTPQVETAMIDRYLAQNPQDRDSFIRAYAILGTQRNLRILGVFARLCLRDGKRHYVDLIPRVWGHIQTNLKHPDVAPLADLLTGLPAPDVETLNRIKSQCAKQP